MAIKCIPSEINSCKSLQCIFLIICRYVTDIMKMCMWKFLHLQEFNMCSGQEMADSAYFVNQLLEPLVQHG